MWLPNFSHQRILICLHFICFQMRIELISNLNVFISDKFCFVISKDSFTFITIVIRNLVTSEFPNNKKMYLNFDLEWNKSHMSTAHIFLTTSQHHVSVPLWRTLRPGASSGLPVLFQMQFFALTYLLRPSLSGQYGPLLTWQHPQAA